MSLCRYPSSVRAVCVNALVRICAGGDQRWSFLPRQQPTSRRSLIPTVQTSRCCRALATRARDWPEKSPSRLVGRRTGTVQRPRTNSRRACPRRLPAINVAFTCHNSVDDKSATRGCALRLLGSAIHHIFIGIRPRSTSKCSTIRTAPMVRRIYKDAQSNIKGQKHTSESASGFCRVSV